MGAGPPGSGWPASRQGVDAREPAGGRKEQMNRWDRFHYVRVAVIVAAFALLAAAFA